MDEALMLRADRYEFDGIGLAPEIEIHAVPRLLEPFAPDIGGQHQRRFAVLVAEPDVFQGVLRVHELEDELLVRHGPAEVVRQFLSQFLEVVVGHGFERRRSPSAP